MFTRPHFRPSLVPALFTLGLVSLNSVPLTAQDQTTQAASQKPLLTILHRFEGFDHYGATPQSTLTLGSDGNFYGVTTDSFTSNNGTVFKMTPAGQFSTLHKFTGTDGVAPVGALVQGKDGAFYGVAEFRGAFNVGTAYRITAEGQYTVLHSFESTEGAYPVGKLLLAPDGSFYGVTVEGNGVSNYGLVFHMTTAGAVTVLHKFDTEADGKYPQAGLAFGPDGALYGTTLRGGYQSFGVVFRLTTDGTTYSVLHRFTNDGGAYPGSALVAGPDGALYGTTSDGGLGDGVLYKITPSGVFTTLHKFSNDGHGGFPYAELTLGADGSFYGTTVNGGTNNAGTVFRMTPAGQVTTLYKFHTAYDGYYPYAGVIFGNGRQLYGLISRGGASGQGTLYKLTLPQ